MIQLLFFLLFSNSFFFQKNVFSFRTDYCRDARPVFILRVKSDRNNEYRIFGSGRSPFVLESAKESSDVEVFQNSDFFDSVDDWSPPDKSIYVPPPLNAIVDVDTTRNAVVYECTLGRDIGFDIVQGPDCAVVGPVSAI